MDAPMNKVFLLVGGKTILTRTLELFEHAPIIGSVVLVVAEVDRPTCSALVEDGRLSKVTHIVTGGSTRHASEYQGLLAIEDEIVSGSIDCVLVHDAVRPFVTQEQLRSVTEEARRTGAAILAIPATERIVTSAADGTLLEGGDDLWVAQTPQAFNARLVLDAHRRAGEDGFVGTDTSSVVERIGHPVAVVAGSQENIKITTSDDLLRAELIAGQLIGEPGLVGLGALTPRV
jgi:2-C-methyl-D-erythritol 4-phosphate cytidylyltransferase